MYVVSSENNIHNNKGKNNSTGIILQKYNILKSLYRSLFENESLVYPILFEFFKRKNYQVLNFMYYIVIIAWELIQIVVL
jgi:hypothetical protein